MIKSVRILSILFIILFLLAACNLPSSQPATEEPNVVFTAAALTVQAMSTQSSPTPGLSFNTPTLPAPQATNTSVTFPTLAVPTATRVSPPTAVCDLAQFVRDVTVPDGTAFAPGATFTKTWRLKNAGTCTWSGYSLVFDSGELMGGTSPTPIGTVSPGQEVDISLNLTAPLANGSYRGYWRIRNTSGVLLPLLGDNSGRFFVDIRVAVSSSGFDLYTRAPDASWVGSAGVVTFGGPDTDVNGFAMFRTGSQVEDRTSPTKVLEIHPQFVNNGSMTGLYPAYTVVPGEHFKAKIGFLAKADGTCGVGDVKFQLNYKEAGVVKPLGEWTKTCDGILKDIDVNLSSLAGKNVQFALAVLANGVADQDWAVWIRPEIILP